jgi:sugar/nucleoside kinase (ribokinase family)
VVSPNELEAEELVGHEFNDEEDRTTAVREMVELGAREAIMTLADGCFAQVLEDGGPALYRARIEPLEPRGAVGSGDAFLAGYVCARYTGSPPAECLRRPARGAPCRALDARGRGGAARGSRRGRLDRPKSGHSRAAGRGGVGSIGGPPVRLPT